MLTLKSITDDYQCAFAIKVEKHKKTDTNVGKL